jgi:hypothetical protein
MASVRMDRRLGVFGPLGTAVLAAIAVNSTLRVLSGRGVEWRGRRYGAGDGDGAAIQQLGGSSRPKAAPARSPGGI